jgi:hypothetical protein
MGRTAVGAVRVPLLPTGAPGTLSASANLYSVPYDMHITGVGLVTKIVSVTKRINGHEPMAEIVFGPDLAIQPYTADAPVSLELELQFNPDSAQSPNIVVDVSEDVTLV